MPLLKPGKHDSPGFTASYFALFGLVVAACAWGMTRAFWVGIVVGVVAVPAGFRFGWIFEKQAEERGSYSYNIWRRRK